MGLKRLDIFTYSVGSQRITVLDCARCGEVFGLTEATDALRRRDGHVFYCPNGHTNSYSLTETAEQRELKEARRRVQAAEAEAKRQRELREWAEKSAKGANVSAGMARAAKARLEHRIRCGVCPHCQRTFKQLAAHMKAKHGK